MAPRTVVHQRMLVVEIRIVTRTAEQLAAAVVDRETVVRGVGVSRRAERQGEEGRHQVVRSVGRIGVHQREPRVGIEPRGVAGGGFRSHSVGRLVGQDAVKRETLRTVEVRRVAADQLVGIPPRLGTRELAGQRVGEAHVELRRGGHLFVIVAETRGIGAFRKGVDEERRQVAEPRQVEEIRTCQAREDERHIDERHEIGLHVAAAVVPAAVVAAQDREACTPDFIAVAEPFFGFGQIAQRGDRREEKVAEGVLPDVVVHRVGLEILDIMFVEMLPADTDGFEHRGPLGRGHAVAGRVVTYGQSVHDGRAVEILRRSVAIDGQRRGVQGVAHRLVAERLLARQQVGHREIDDGLRDHLAEFVVHEIDERLFLERSHPRGVAGPRGCDGHEVHIQVPAGLAHQFLRLGVPLRPGTKGIGPVAGDIEPVVRHGSDPAHQFLTRRSGEPPARSIDREGIDRRPALRTAGFRDGPLPVPAPFGQRLVAGISRPFERLRGRNSGKGAVLRQPHAVNRAFRIARGGPEQRGRVLRHSRAARRLRPFAVAGPQRAFVDPDFGRELRRGVEGREKRGCKQDSFHRHPILSSTSPAAPMHPARLPSRAATSSVSSPQTDIICRRTPSRNFSR